MDFRFINNRLDESIAILELDDPSANTLTYDLLHELEYKFLALEADPQVQAIVITGKGARFFSGGVNIGMLLTAGKKFNSNFILYAAEVLEAITHSKKLIVAAINGNITGGGLELALVAHKRVAVEGEYNIGFPEVRLGVIPGMGGTQRLTRLVGPQTALEMITQGQFISAERAKEIGLVDEIYPQEGFLNRAIAFTREQLNALKPAPTLSSETGAALAQSLSTPFPEGLATLRKENGLAVITLTEASVSADAFSTLRALNERLLEARIDEDVYALAIDLSAGLLRADELIDNDDFVVEYGRRVFSRIDGFARLCVLYCNRAMSELEMELALACDFRFCDQAGLTAEVALPTGELAILQRYPSQLPAALAGKQVTLARLVETGLFRCIDEEDPLAWVARYMTRFLPPNGASTAIGYAKLAISKGYAESIPSALLLERHLQEQLFIGADSQEGMSAYIEKRTPNFKGA
ncbi:enoyl-CoA hydratase/isomerase family protein [Hahella sp. HN01]|uniref:enoyl-CoA hydratase/isomerase family protein n=1 Tax=Hahella sp. HN01 TaxID=2847262 RepID=UPI001C1EA82A|nr:enoyl-CoA hydratase-related protein [Hahella sp. HN01]MBU6950862.1 enoyl-CoA hydratase/isomerase family protein [Hahella sp. HN01]